MKKISSLIVIFLFLLCSCEKDRHCECKNSNGTYDAGVTKSGYFAAKKHCKSLSSGDTQCYLK